MVKTAATYLPGLGLLRSSEVWYRRNDGVTSLKIRMLNSGGIAIAQVTTPNGVVSYDGDAAIDGVPGTAAPVMIDFADVAGSNCGSLLPTGNVLDDIQGVAVTCVDNGMPVVMLKASDFGKTGYESPEELEADDVLKQKVEAIRLEVGQKMNLGNVSDKTVPKMSLIAPAKNGGVVMTRTFIPHRVHQSIGVLGAASIAAACCIPGTVADGVAESVRGGELDIEHPSGRFTVEINLSEADGEWQVLRSALLRTTRKLMSGEVYVPEGD